MAEERTLLKVDLDAKNLITQAGIAQKSIADMVATEGAAELVGALKGVGAAMGVLGAAAFATKVALDLTLEAESVKRINEQFENLTRTAGLSTEVLHKGLVDVAAGLADDTDLLKAANEAIIGMGSSAEKLPQILELARKASKVFGGELLQTFETLNQALATGQTRMLKQFGIVVDNEGAYARFAKTLGVTVGQLTDSEKRQAIMNAVLEQGEQRFKGISLSTDNATSALTRLKVSLSEIKETATLAFEKIAGPKITAMLSGFADFTAAVGDGLKAKFGSGVEATSARIRELNYIIKDTQKNISDLSSEDLVTTGRAHAFRESTLKKYSERIRMAQEELTKLHALEKEQIGAAPDDIGKTEQSEAAKRASRRLTTEDRAKNLLVEAQMIQQLDAAESSRIRSQMAVETDAAAMRALFSQQEQELLNQRQAKLIQIDAQEQLGQLTAKNAAALRLQLEQQTTAEIERVKLSAIDAELRASENLARKQREGLAGFAAGAKAAAASAGKDFGDMSLLGKKSFDAFAGAASNSLLALGAGSKNAAAMMGGFFLGALADIAETQGKIMLAQALVGNFAAASAGAGLLVLAGFLRSKAGSAGASSAPIGGEIGGGGGYASAPESAMAERPQPTDERKKREVTINIHGNYLETPESRRYLLEMIRQETDATGFTYNQVGYGAG